jgi:hypothetical protein
VTIRDALRAWSPWSPADGIRWIVIGLAGIVMTSASWWVAHHQDQLNDQIGWATVAVLGFAIAGYANISWLLQARFAIVQRRDALLPDEVAVDTSTTRLIHHDDLVAAPELTRFHRASCPLAQGKGWRPVSEAAARRGGQEPCGVCRP